MNDNSENMKLADMAAGDPFLHGIDLPTLFTRASFDGDDAYMACRRWHSFLLGRQWWGRSAVSMQLSFAIALSRWRSFPLPI